ncbi:MAG: hypothetical protein IAB80_03055 [Bacteroidetes bacterium]|uniref:Uncharacterized protein n=1 Tax=Candidatus Cryptobacteroides excrementipullorum TaxID=2840761 RepID=A0A9D9NL85_9BACT|nr:hypothetical protein [Candidatus Cryptobacteroides excrementipullorum]
MKGFNIKINGRTLSAGVNDVGMSFIFLNCMDGECRITVRGVDRIVGKRYVWAEEQMELGQKVEFEFSDVDSVSQPIKVSEAEMMSLDDIKLEAYRRAKKTLLEEGVI